MAEEEGEGRERELETMEVYKGVWWMEKSWTEEMWMYKG